MGSASWIVGVSDESSHAAAGGVGPSLAEEVQFPPLQSLPCGLVTGFIVRLVTYVFYGSREKFTKKIFLYETSDVQAILVILPYLDR